MVSTLCRSFDCHVDRSSPRNTSVLVLACCSWLEHLSIPLRLSIRSLYFQLTPHGRTSQGSGAGVVLRCSSRCSLFCMRTIRIHCVETHASDVGHHRQLVQRCDRHWCGACCARSAFCRRRFRNSAAHSLLGKSTGVELRWSWNAAEQFGRERRERVL